MDSWAFRGAVPNVGRFNFTRADELARNSGPSPFPFQFDAESGWLPPALRTALLQGLPALLNPFGSPNGPGTSPATWGVGPWDLYHCHVLVWTGGSLPLPPQVAGRGQILTTMRLFLWGLAAAAPGAIPSNLQYTRELRRLLLEGFLAPSGVPTRILEQYGALAGDAVSAATAAQPLLLLWHSFENAASRPPGMVTENPQRHWFSQIAPTVTMPTAWPHPGRVRTAAVTEELFEIAFFVNKAGIVSAMPGGGIEAAAMFDATWNEVSPHIARRGD